MDPIYTLTNSCNLQMTNSNLLAKDRLTSVCLVRVLVRKHRLQREWVVFFFFSCQCLHMLAPGRTAASTLDFAAFYFERTLNA